MTYQNIATMIAGVGLPYAYYQFPNNTPQTPPFIVFYYEDSDDVYADMKNYQRIINVTLEFYSDSKDFSYEALIETTLTNNGLTYRKYEQYIETERMHETVYEFEALITT